MLYSYSNQGLEHNWLNQTIVGVLRDGMQAIIDGQGVDQWPDCLPEETRVVLSTRIGIRDRLGTFWQEFAALEPPAQYQLQQALDRQTDLPALLSDGINCPKIDAFSEAIGDATKNLFRFLFELLTEIKAGTLCIRDAQYQAIYQHLEARICPFCGLVYLRAPGAPRHDLDHYMPISKYPFAGADLQNLPPMCSECNSSYKGTADILYDEHGNRRECSDPYDGPSYAISLADSRPFEGNTIRGVPLPRWQIDFLGEPAGQAETWNAIFKIRERYQRDVLDADFLSWLDHFAGWYVKTNSPDLEIEAIAASIPRYIDTVIQDGWADRAFLKAEVFRMLDRECKDAERGADVKSFLKNVVDYSGNVVSVAE